MNTTGNIPSPSAPFLADDGRISQAWWQFMVSLFSRTGSGQGVDTLALMAVVDEQQVTIAAQQAMITTLTDTATNLQTELDALKAAVKVPVGYSNVTIAHTTRKIPYY